VTIADNGRGMPEDLRPTMGHIGLASMQERAEWAGGWLEISGPCGAGTRVEYWIPDEETPE
jgi:signal transduction histidine kinase